MNPSCSISWTEHFLHCSYPHQYGLHLTKFYFLRTSFWFQGLLSSCSLSISSISLYYVLSSVLSEFQLHLSYLLFAGFIQVQTPPSKPQLSVCHAFIITIQSEVSSNSLVISSLNQFRFGCMSFNFQIPGVFLVIVSNFQPSYTVINYRHCYQIIIVYQDMHSGPDMMIKFSLSFSLNTSVKHS